MKYLSQANIIAINKQTLIEHGGNFIPPEKDTLYQLTMELAAGQISLEELKAWFAARCVA